MPTSPSLRLGTHSFKAKLAQRMAHIYTNSSPTRHAQSSAAQSGRSRAGSFSTLWSSADVPFLLDPRLNRPGGSSFVSNGAGATPSTIRSSYFASEASSTTDIACGAVAMFPSLSSGIGSVTRWDSDARDFEGEIEQVEEVKHQLARSSLAGSDSDDAQSALLPPVSSSWEPTASYPTNAGSSSLSSHQKVPWSQPRGSQPSYQKRRPTALNIASISNKQWDQDLVSPDSASTSVTGTNSFYTPSVLTATQKGAETELHPVMSATIASRTRSPTAEELYMLASQPFQVDYSLGLLSLTGSAKERYAVASDRKDSCEVSSSGHEQDSNLSLLSQSQSTVSSDSMSQSRESHASESSASSFGFSYLDKSRRTSGMPARGSARLSSASSHPASPSRQFRSLSNTSADSSPLSMIKPLPSTNASVVNQQHRHSSSQSWRYEQAAHARRPSSPLIQQQQLHPHKTHDRVDSVSHSTLVLPAAIQNVAQPARTPSTDSLSWSRRDSPLQSRTPSWLNEVKDKPLPSPLAGIGSFPCEADRTRPPHAPSAYPPNSSRTADLVAKQSRPRRGSLASSISSSVSQFFHSSGQNTRASFGDSSMASNSKPGSMAHGKGSSHVKPAGCNWSSHLSAGLTLHLQHEAMPDLQICMTYLAYDPFGRPESLVSSQTPSVQNKRSRSKSAKGKEVLGLEEQAGILEFGADTTNGAQEFYFVVGCDAPVLRRLTIAEQSTDLLTRQAMLSVDSQGLHQVSGCERKGLLAWQFVYSVEERVDQDNRIIAGQRTLRPLRFSCSATLLDPNNARKGRLLKMVKKQVSRNILSNPVDGAGSSISSPDLVDRRPSDGAVHDSTRHLSGHTSWSGTAGSDAILRHHSRGSFELAAPAPNITGLKSFGSTSSRLMSRLRKASFVGRPDAQVVSSPTHHSHSAHVSMLSPSSPSSSQHSPTEPRSPASAQPTRLAPPGIGSDSHGVKGRKRGASLGEASRAYPIGLPRFTDSPELPTVPGSDDSIAQVANKSHRERDLPALPQKTTSSRNVSLSTMSIPTDRPLTAAEQIKASWLSRERQSCDDRTEDLKTPDARDSRFAAAQDDLQLVQSPTQSVEHRRARRLRSKTDERDLRSDRMPWDTMPRPNLPLLRLPEVLSIKSRRSNRALRSTSQTPAQSPTINPAWLVSDDRFQPAVAGV